MDQLEEEMYFVFNSVTCWKKTKPKIFLRKSITALINLK